MPPKLAISKKPHSFQLGGKTYKYAYIHSYEAGAKSEHIQGHKKCTGIDLTSKKQSY